MKKVIAFLLAALLLAGCSADKSSKTPTKTTLPEQTTSQETTPAPEKSAFLRQSRKVLGQENLYYIPCDELEQMAYAELYQVGRSLVFCDFTFDEAYENITYHIISVSLDDGSVQARLTLPCSGYTSAFAKGDKLVFVDGFFGKILI